MTETDAIVALIALFEREGYARVEPPVLQPADVFVDLSGEDIRRRHVRDAGCRPARNCACGPNTPSRSASSISHSPRRPSPAGYCYGGPVFRMRPGESGEFLQAGIESIGRARRCGGRCGDPGLALEGLAALGLRRAQP